MLKNNIIFDEIARRDFSVEGSDEKIVVILGRPQKLDLTKDYYCPYKLFSKKEVIRKIFGVDQFQSIQLALKAIDDELHGIERSRASKLKWLGGDF